ncbi:MAG: hypothetical protein ACXIUQ_00015 [Cecembia sp.]
MSERLKGILLFFTALISLRFFEIRVAGDLIGTKMPVAFCFALSLLSMRYYFISKNGFTLPVRILSLALFFSILMALIYWDQSIPQSIRATATSLIYPLFFLLLQFKVKTKTIEQVIIALGAVYVLLYTFQFMFPSKAYFGYALGATEGEYANEGRGINRIIFPGAGVFWLAVFISISKITTQAKIAYHYLAMAVLGLIVPLLQVIRQLVAFVVVLYTFHFGTQFSLAKKVLFISIFIGAGFYILSLDLPFIKALEETTQRDTQLGSDYIRVVAGKYFLFDFSEDIILQIFGNGFAHYNSNYGRAIERLTQDGLFLEDIGIIGLYVQAGIFAVLAWLLIFYKSFTISIPKEYIYCKYYLWMILATSLTSGSIFNIHYTFSSVVVLYIFHIETQNKSKEKLKKVLRYLKQNNIPLEKVKKASVPH